jgi:hypothetical protein
MNGHISKKILIEFFQGETRKEHFITTHINSCAKCRNNFHILKNITAPTPDNKTNPGRHVLKNISSFYDKTVSSYQAPDPGKSLTLWSPRFRLAGAAALAICAGLVIYAVTRHLQFENAPMEASSVKGMVKIDTTKLKKGQPLNPGVILTTGDNSKLAIIYGKIVKLNAGPHTRIYITKSHIDKKTGKIYFEIVVDKGLIIAVFDKSGNLEYTLKTPHGRVSSSGSTIAMEVDSSKTRVLIKEGSANLSSTDGHSVNLEEGYGYTITSGGIISAASSPDDEESNGTTLDDNTLKDLMADDPDDDTLIQ